ncbi:hypothetical protein, partial [Streptomyces gardneri]|uniref:hypothetical protein n=2 Tax=Streptomyces gardneri TaxID=66892 RepID=UPI0037D55749
STNLALIFGTLLSSQGADASFVLTLAGFPPGFSFVPKPIRSFRSDFLGAFRSVSLSLRALPAVPTLSDPFGV